MRDDDINAALVELHTESLRRFFRLEEIVEEELEYSVTERKEYENDEVRRCEAPCDVSGKKS